MWSRNAVASELAHSAIVATEYARDKTCYLPAPVDGAELLQAGLIVVLDCCV